MHYAPSTIAKNRESGENGEKEKKKGAFFLLSTQDRKVNLSPILIKFQYVVLNILLYKVNEVNYVEAPFFEYFLDTHLIIFLYFTLVYY